MNKLLLLLTLTLTLSCCNKDDSPFSSKDQLPEETQTGANTVGCLVNGKVYLPSQRGLNSPVNCFYEYDNGEFYFTLAFEDMKNFGPTVSIHTGRLTLVAGQTYLLNKNSVTDGDYTGGGASYFPSLQNFYYTNTTKTGELKITRLDLQNSIISGIFWFDAVNSEGEKVQVREGRFDMHY
jgi:hypothetical protein